MRLRPACQVLESRPPSWNGERWARVEPPPDAGGDHPTFEPSEVVVVEAEMAPHRGPSRQVEDLGGRHPPARHVEQAGDDPEQRVHLTYRPVREAYT